MFPGSLALALMALPHGRLSAMFPGSLALALNNPRVAVTAGDSSGVLVLALILVAILLVSALLLWRRRGVSALVVEDEYHERAA